MNQDIIAMAREAGFEVIADHKDGNLDWVCFTEEIERFAALVAAAEREACAKILEANAKLCSVMVEDILRANANAIRARGETK